MKFKSKGEPLNDEGMERICDILGVSDPEIWAVITVETRGFGFFKNRYPQILFERHIFHRLTDGAFDSGNENISHVNPGGYSGGIDEYKRLKKAMALDQKAAIQSASWGIGQVMGFNYKTAGFSTVEAFVKSMVKNENEQLLAVANFILKNNLAGALQRQQWVSFARGYNGPDHARNNYALRLEASHAKYKVSLPDLSLRSAQAALSFLGFDPGPIDGLRGRRTRSALIGFQERFGLVETGELDLHTENNLIAEAFS